MRKTFSVKQRVVEPLGNGEKTERCWLGLTQKVGMTRVMPHLLKNSLVPKKFETNQFRFDRKKQKCMTQLVRKYACPSAIRGWGKLARPKPRKYKYASNYEEASSVALCKAVGEERKSTITNSKSLSIFTKWKHIPPRLQKCTL